MTLIDKVRRYLQTPKGRQAMDRARNMARDPRNQQKARGLLDKLRGHGGKRAH